jgi:hypothetical protein
MKSGTFEVQGWLFVSVERVTRLDAIELALSSNGELVR